MFERFPAGSESRDLYAVGPDGGEPTLLRSPGEYPHWSADGSRLAFFACLNPPDCTTGLAWLDRATGDVHWFPRPEPDLFTACAIWAPSGTKVACEGLSESDPTRNGVYTVRATDGSGLTRVTRNPGAEDFPLAFSPDGKYLLFDRVDPSRAGSANRALFVTATSGGRPHRITPWGVSDDYASWSPDGRTIVFGTDGSLYRVSPEGRRLAEIRLQVPDRSSAPVAFDVAFSPDGRRIVFSLAGPERGLYTARLDGSQVRRLTTSPTEDHHAAWGPAPSVAGAAIVGTWERITTCKQRVRALHEAGLGAFAVEHAAGEGWVPGVTDPDEITDPNRPCEGAVPLKHGHFFTENGEFGSTDNEGDIVDDGRYRVIDNDTVVIDKEFGAVTFDFRVDDESLFLDPVLPECSAEGCFAAQWAVAVAYPGRPWRNADR